MKSIAEIPASRLALTRLVAASSLLLLLLTLLFLPGCGSTGVSNPVEVIAPTSGSPQSAAINTAFASPLVGTVMMGSSPIGGAIVTFSAPLTGASGTFAGGTTSVTITATATGVATTPIFTANSTAGAYSVVATVIGATGSTSFNLTNTAGAPAAITATSGTPQSATVDTAFAEPLAATVVDSFQNVVSGATVTFTAPASGASGTFSGGSNIATATTDVRGLATSPAFTANGSTGNYTVTATVSGVGTAASFKLTNLSAQPKTITATSGTPQSAAANTAFAAPLVATVTVGGVPLSGATVKFTAPTTGASGKFAGGVDTATTDVNGVATSAVFTANGITGTYMVAATVAGGTAPADFALTNTAASYSFYVTGQEIVNDGPNFYALAGAITVDGNGNILGGEQDYNDGFGFTSPQPSGDTIIGGTLTMNATTGIGRLTLITDNPNLGVSGTETLGVQFVNANHALVIQFDGTATSSGSLDTQTLPSTISGNYAFTLTGVDFNYAPVVYGGIFSVSGTTISGGLADTNDNGTVLMGRTFTGTINPPDAFGRGNIPGITPGDNEIILNYYVVSPEAIRIIDIDAADSAMGSAFSQGSGSFSAASLGSSVFGVESNNYGALFAAAGQFTTNPTGGTFSGVADDNELDNGVTATSPIAGPYAIGGNGYGSMTITGGVLGSVSVLGIYATDPNLNLNDPNNTASGLGGALVTDLDVPLGGSGLLVPQTDTDTASFNGNYAFGGQDFNFLAEGAGWEFDFAGNGPVGGLALNGTGIISDPSDTFGLNPTDTGRPFTGTAVPDGTNPGRYTLPLAITVAGVENDFATVVYQANGGQLFWLDMDNGISVFLGFLQQQGALTGVHPQPETRATAKREKTTRKALRHRIVQGEARRR